MCQAKKNGGKRCAIHMLGSRAILRIAKALSGADDKTVTTVFKDLRKEGSGLPAPTPDMVQAFADQQRFSAQFNPDLNDHDRKIATRQWGAAAEDAPDGGTFHAWKHTIGETMRRSRSRVTAIAVSGTLSFALAACGGGGSLANEVPSTPSVTSSPSASAPATDPNSETVDNDKWGIAAGPAASDAYGTYNQVEVAADSPLMQYDEAVATDDAKAAYSAEDIRSAQQTVSQFYVSEGIDSTLVYDNSQAAKDAWLQQNSGKIDPDFQADAYASIQDASASQAYGIVEGNYGDWRHTAPYNVDPAAYEANTARVYFRDVKLNSIAKAENGDLRFDYSSSYVRPVVVDGEARWETVEATQSYSVQKQTDGTWKLTGWINNSTSNWM